MALDRAVIAANNNADLCEAVFGSWGLCFARRSYAFVALDPPPPYYSNVTITSRLRTEEVISLLCDLTNANGGAVGLKDSFCELDPQKLGLEVLFQAIWIWRDAQASGFPEGWLKVESPTALANWEKAWKRSGSPTSAHMFRSALLQNFHITVLGKMDAGECVAGCIANRSSDCIGISNVFSVYHDENIFKEATGGVAFIAPDLPIVGYKSQDNLEAVRNAGYQTTGDLKILVSPQAGS